MFNPYQYYNQDPRYAQYQSQMQPQMQPQPVMRTVSLQGKTVDSIDVVKATDVPLDGSVSYFPIADNSAIITKQLQQDGTTKLVVYKPVDDKKDTPKYLTRTDVDVLLDDVYSKIDELDLGDIKDDLKNFKKQLKDMNDDIKDLKRKGV